jgi:hypothetical protein
VPATYSVNGSQGVMAVSAGDVGSQQLAALSLRYQEITFTSDWVTGTGDLTVKAAYRFDSGQYYGLDMLVDLDTQTITALTLTQTGGTIVSVPMAMAHTPGTPIGVRIHSTNRQRARIWSTADPEPSAWDIDILHDTLPAGVVALAATAGTSVPVPPPFTNAIWMWGAEQGITGMINETTYNYTILSATPTSSNNYLVTPAGQGRDGVGYAAQIQQTAGSGFFATSALSTQTPVLTYYFKFVGSLPTAAGDIVYLTAFDVAGFAGPTTYIQFIPSTGRIIVTTSGGSTATGPVVTANVWHRVDVLVNASGGTRLIDWYYDGVAQTQATRAGGPNTFNSISWGPLAATTCNIYFDDMVLSNNVADFPMGDVKIVRLMPDPAGTITEAGTANVWCRYQTNGSSLDVTFNAADILAATTEFPPTNHIFASDAGVYQRTSGTGNSMSIPFDDTSLNPGEGIGAVQLEALMWGSTVGTMSFFSQANVGGADTTVLANTAVTWGSPQTIQSWAVAMYSPSGGWTLTKLNDLNWKLQSTVDNTPLPGYRFFMAEVAVRVTEVDVPITDVYFDDFECIECEAV